MAIYKQGARGAIVKQIQKVVGCYPDGIWGPLTTEAVKAWQQAHGLTADGIVGPKTLAMMTPPIVATALKLRKSKRRITEIIIHCTATPEGRDYTVAQIRAQHMAPVSKGGRGWSDIGYHYLVTRDGNIHEGRSVDISGAHCQGHNAHSIGIAYVGGVENRIGVPYEQLKAKDTRTEAQKAALVALLVDLRKLYPQARIYGHRDFTSLKACPSFDARKEYQSI